MLKRLGNRTCLSATKFPTSSQILLTEITLLKLTYLQLSKSHLNAQTQLHPDKRPRAHQNSPEWSI